MNKKYFRPEWTCGRYNREHRVALYYNLIEGMSYLFEDDSADVVGEVLSVPRNGCFSLESLSEKTNTAVESLAPFLDVLAEHSLITDHMVTKDGISAYRKDVAKFKCTQAQTVVKTTKDKLPMDVSSAEMDYTEKVGGITSVMFELTYDCSERCIHCYNIGATRNDSEQSYRRDREELTLNDYRSIIDQLYEQGLVKVCLSGGDPFQKNIAWDIIEYLYNKGIAFDVYTNGLRLAGKTNRLANYYPRVVGVSIYSGCAAEHDGITRIPGSWERSMNVVRELSALAVPMNLKCCVMRPNVKHYFEVADIARQYGAVAQFEVSISDSIDGDRCASHHLRLPPEIMEIVLRDDNIPLYVGKEAPNYGGQPRLIENNACGAGQNSFCITPEGNLIPCCAFHASFGNLRQMTIKEIVNNSEDLRTWQSLTLAKYKECGRHDYCDYCNLCPGNNFTEHGNPTLAAENNCYMAKIRHGLAMKMMKGYDPLQGKTLKERLSELADYEKETLMREYSHDYSDKSLMVGG